MNLIKLLVTLVASISRVSSSNNWIIKQPHLIRTGFTNILWEYVDSNDFKVNQNVTKECKLSLNYVNQSMSEGQDWPIKLFEASGSIPDDFSGYGYLAFGNIDQCKQLNWINYDGNNQLASYCLTSFLPNNKTINLSDNIFTSKKLISCEYGACFKIGFCLPSDCSSNDLQIIASNALKPYDWDLFSVDHCLVNETFVDKLIKAPILQKLCLVLLIVIISTVLVANILEYKSSKLNNNNNNETDNYDQSNWFYHLSFKSSYRQIVQPNWSSNKMINLLQYSTMLHIIVIITHMISVPILLNAVTIFNFPYKSQLQLDDNLIFSITLSDWYFEGIFAYGGFGRSLETWKRIGPKTTLKQLIVSTFTKLLSLSVLITTILIIHVNLPLISSGPLNMAEKASNSCLGFFWQTVFLTNNQAKNVNQQCLGHFWSVSVESQCLLVIVLLVFLYKRYPKIGLTVNLITIIGSLYYVGFLYYHNQHSAHLISEGITNIKAIEDYNVNLYTRSSTHLWIYCTTVLCTYLIMNNYVPTIIKFPILRSINTKMVPFCVLLFLFQPIYLRLIKPYQNQLILAIYSVVHRLFMIVFFLFCGFRMTDEAKKVFDRPEEPKSHSNGLNSNGKLKSINGPMISYNSNCYEKKSINSVEQMRKLKFYTIIATILRSTYCIHITILTISYNSLRRPITSPYQLLILMVFQLILCIFGGLLFHFFILGPFTSITVFMRKKIKSQ
ncbi:uncharacterized protein LOC128394701 [Panonychus citri]|uniref:uncharacterized protein LOC128394701 n=1 Tax=Panonychus citri TaxID=50023 RepID=UPI002307DFBE|nr:uncharacterized protein LOC128394701 [Panonychus citri]